MDRPEVTLIVTTYQMPYHLERVLASAARQTVAQRMEVVVSDDGSTDETPQVVAEFAAGHVPNAEHMPLDRIESLPARVGPDDALLLYCQRGERAVRAYHLLKGTLQGRLSLLQDGYEGWLRGGLAETADVTVGGMEPPSLAVVERS